MAENLRIIEYCIPESFDGMTVGAFLRSRHYSRRIINHLRNTYSEDNAFGPNKPGIFLEGRPAWTIARLSAGQRLTVGLLETEESPHVPESAIPLDILYEDADLCVIHKPAGMPVHPSMGHSENTLGNALCYDTHHRLGFDRYVERIVNRLDRDTSGTVISAKNALSASVLGEAVGKGEIHRIYFAVCSGDIRKWDRNLEWVSEETEAESAQVFRGLERLCLKRLAVLYPEAAFVMGGAETSRQAAASTQMAAAVEASAVGSAASIETEETAAVDGAGMSDGGAAALLRLRISAPLGRLPGSVVARCVDSDGERAVTHLQMLHYDSVRDCSLLLLKLETGRTHQIRVHLQYLGHPLPGDFLYNPDTRLIQRQALHALLLQFSQPVTGETITAFAPPPADLAAFLRPMDVFADR